MAMSFVEQVETLLSQARPDAFYLQTYPGLPRNVVDRRAHVGNNGPNTYVAGPGESSLISEPAELLERLYAGADPEERNILSRVLMERLNRVNARVVARTLAVTDQLNALLVTIDDEGTSEELWRGLIHTMRYESSLFSEQNLQIIETATKARLRLVAEREKGRAANVQRLPRGGMHGPERPAPTTVRYTVPQDPVINEARAVIARIRYLRLAKAIRESRNPAIDTDRQTLLSRLEIMGFSDKLSKASNAIDERAAVAASEIDVKTVMDLARTFLEEFVEEACRKIEGKVGKPVPSGPKMSHYAPYRQYLEAAGVIGPEESVLLQSLYNFLSNQSAHKLGAAPEQLRVAHATVIEWCLLVAGRVKTLIGA
jgi:hypothetical protein